MYERSRSTLPFLALLLTAAACGAEPADSGGDPAARTAAEVSVATPAQEAAAPASTSLSDAEIAHVAVTANAIDVEMARLAEDRTRTPGVLAFARTMITDHTAVNERAAELARRLGVTPAENSTSRSLQAGADEARERLSGLEGEAFDRAYIEREVGYHQAVLDALDGLLIPQASNGELRGLLEEVRPAIAAHLEHAKALRDSPEGR